MPKPKFDPNAPFEVVDKPKFDPSKPFDSVGEDEPSLGHQAKDLFESTVIDQLPALGAAGGGLAGGVVGSVPGALGGAGAGGYLGKAAQNAYNSLMRPEKAPKEAAQYVTQPLQSGAENVVLEALGMGAGKALEGAGNIAGKGLEAATKSLNPVSSYIKGKLGSAGRLAKDGFYKLESNLTGIPEQSIRTYAENPKIINEMNKEFGGDVSAAADSIREGFQKKIQSARSGLNDQVASAIKASKTQSPDVEIWNVVDRLEKSKSGLNPKIQSDVAASNRIDDLISQVKSLAKEEANGVSLGKTDVTSMDRIKGLLQEAAKPSYDAGGAAIFQGGPLAARAAKGGAAEARLLANEAAPEGYRTANKSLERLHRIEGLINKNLIKEGKPESALLAAGSGGNQRNAKLLKMLEDTTGAPITKQAQQLSAMRDFGNPEILASDKTGKAVARMIGGSALGGAASGGDPKGFAAGAVLSSPLALKGALNLNYSAKQALGRFAPALESAASRGPQALQATISILSKKPEFLEALKQLESGMASPAFAGSNGAQP